MWPLIPLKSSCDHGYDRYSDTRRQIEVNHPLLDRIKIQQEVNYQQAPDNPAPSRVQPCSSGMY